MKRASATGGRAVLIFLLVTSLPAFAACRQKASPQECDQLLDKFAELVVKERFADAGPETIAAERARERSEAKGDDAFKNCTSEVQAAELACAMKATSSEAVIKCLE
ncbi:hypothetical protein AKJ09_02528 [Labilithrix luteola]|uniref:Lipoprotein n=1 Tax=Labilithrix luteola TaxID=1391654 RepID=A0A0K1PRW3_9BACT|nr:hypothetical protein [Labilithrix luteola]AKU95864.1 hypothetical protein AKJ09_02528 [Labilithrix luteola]